MDFLFLLHLFSLVLFSFSSSIHAQQPYEAKATTTCSNTDNSTSVLGYTCNGVNSTCQSYIIFRSLPPYNTAASISNLLSANASQVSEINSVSGNATLPTGKMVIVPVFCSCTGAYYQKNASYVVQSDDTPFLIANNTFQGLSTCQAINAQRSNLTTNIFAGSTLTVPVRCACPTKSQVDQGINYLLSYLIVSGDTVSGISVQFGGDTGLTLEANGLSESNAVIYPFTTLLVPLKDPPNSSLTSTPPPPPPPSSPSSSSTNLSKTWVYIVVGIAVGAVAVLVIGLVVFCTFCRKTTKKSDPVSQSLEASPGKAREDKRLEYESYSAEFLEGSSSTGQSLKIFKYQELQSATNDFSPSNCIKGSVYRGTINQDLAAIKKMNGDVKKEINILNKINHFNLIRLSGVCFHDGFCYLVYEHAANGPLSEWIYGDNIDQKGLSWRLRMQIALDVATGLSYLHTYTNPLLVHQDITSSNVLLDGDFRAKIANFHLSRSAEGQDGEFVLTRHIVGTKGYLAPEYLENGFVSTKLDVYAFGILLLEIISGKPAAALYPLSENTFNAVRDGNGTEKLEFIDPSLGENCPLELAVAMFRIIGSCLKNNPAARPSMDEVVPILSGILSTSFARESLAQSHSRNSNC